MPSLLSRALSALSLLGVCGVALVVFAAKFLFDAFVKLIAFL